MPEIIIEQSQNVINYINMLKLPICEALKNHMVNINSGIIATEGNKLFMQFIKSIPVTGIEAAERGFLVNISGITNMWTIRKFLILLKLSKGMWIKAR